METLGKSHDARLQDVRNRRSSEMVLLENKSKEVLHLREELLKSEVKKLLSAECLHARKDLRELQKSCHPGFVIPFDNIDFHLLRRNMSMSNQNRDVHWVNHSMVENRVSGNHLSTVEEKDILDIPNIKFLPRVDNQRRQRMNYVVLVSRILVDYFDSFSVFKDVCVRHIPHRYSREMSVKSRKVKYMQYSCPIYP